MLRAQNNCSQIIRAITPINAIQQKMPLHQLPNAPQVSRANKFENILAEDSKLSGDGEGRVLATLTVIEFTHNFAIFWPTFGVIIGINNHLTSPNLTDHQNCC